MADLGGRYRLGRLAGAGDMSEVWLRYDGDLGRRPLAVKMMRPALLAEPEDTARFLREMRLAARMQHPNIMTVRTTGTNDGHHRPLPLASSPTSTAGFPEGTVLLPSCTCAMQAGPPSPTN